MQKAECVCVCVLSLQVTGKAVMLDEIINYVQSLQRQVEVLSFLIPNYVCPLMCVCLSLCCNSFASLLCLNSSCR